MGGTSRECVYFGVFSSVHGGFFCVMRVVVRNTFALVRLHTDSGRCESEFLPVLFVCVCLTFWSETYLVG